MAIDIAARLGDALGYRFADAALAEMALVHRSAGACSNERLEFLGDAVIALTVADWLYANKPDLAEGDLTRMRASLVNRDALASAAESLQLGTLLTFGGGGASPAMLEDGFEAVIGAVFLDSGYTSAREVVQRLFATRFSSLGDAESLKDPKTRLQELLQARGVPLPQYRLVRTHGPQHMRRFESECSVAELGLQCRGEGASKRDSEQTAAGAALARIEG
jgi:ribonuclease-3